MTISSDLYVIHKFTEFLWLTMNIKMCEEAMIFIYLCLATVHLSWQCVDFTKLFNLQIISKLKLFF